MFSAASWCQGHAAGRGRELPAAWQGNGLQSPPPGPSRITRDVSSPCAVEPPPGPSRITRDSPAPQGHHASRVIFLPLLAQTQRKGRREREREGGREGGRERARERVEHTDTCNDTDPDARPSIHGCVQWLQQASICSLLAFISVTNAVRGRSRHGPPPRVTGPTAPRYRPRCPAIDPWVCL